MLLGIQNSHFGKQFLIKLDIHLSDGPADFPKKDTKSYVQEIWNSLLLSYLFTIVKTVLDQIFIN